MAFAMVGRAPALAVTFMSFAVGTQAMGLSLLQTSTVTAERSAATVEFESYLTQYGRTYSGSEEYTQRLRLFQQRLDRIKVHNAKKNRRWTAGLSELTDRTEEEMSFLRGWRRVKSPTGDSAHVASLLSRTAQLRVTTDEVDWRNLTMASNVPDQGACGSCWAVATAAMLEARHEIHMKKSRSFSAQQLVNCVQNPQECGGQGGCQGATVELALDYVAKMGLEKDDDDGVPYAGVDMTCKQPMPSLSSTSFLSDKALEHSRKTTGGAATGMRSWYTLPPNQALPLMHALADGPVAIAAAASGWTLYMGGIFDDCSKDAVVDHAITVFGYGKSKDGVKYWTVRNSWGKSWGEDGYIRLLRHDTPEKDDAHCGVDRDPAAGIACKPYPKQQAVCGMCGMLLDSVVAQFA